MKDNAIADNAEFIANCPFFYVINETCSSISTRHQLPNGIGSKRNIPKDAQT